MLVITGATGQLGSRIVQHLLARLPADQIGVSVRDTDRVADLAAEGVRVRHGDYRDPASLATSFEGADQVLVVSASEVGDGALSQMSAAFEAAQKVGARVVYTSHQGVSHDSTFAPMPDHAAAEKILAGSGRPYTSLRNGFYAATVPMLLGQALETGELVAPADGPVSWTTHDDLAEAAAIILTGTTSYAGLTAPLTGPEALDLAAVAGILSELTGRTIRRVVAGDDEWRTGLVTHAGVPEEMASMLLGMFHASRRGEFAATSPALAELLGRTATPLRSFLAGTVG